MLARMVWGTHAVKVEVEKGICLCCENGEQKTESKKQKTDHTWPDQRKLQSRGSNSRTCVLDLNKEWTNLIERPYLRVVHLSDVYLPDIVSFVHAACQKNKACWQKHNNICISFLFQKIFSPQPYVRLPPYTGVYQISWIMRVLNLPRDPISPQHLCRTLFFRYCSTTNNSTCDAPEERFLSKETSRQMWLLLFQDPPTKLDIGTICFSAKLTLKANKIIS